MAGVRFDFCDDNSIVEDMRKKFQGFVNQFDIISHEPSPLKDDDQVYVIRTGINGSSKTVGYAVLDIQEREGTIKLDEIFVEPEYRGNGVLTGLLRFMAKMAHEDFDGELRQVELGVHNLNGDAKAAYFAKGFQCRCDHKRCADRNKVDSENVICPLSLELCYGR